VLELALERVPQALPEEEPKPATPVAAEPGKDAATDVVKH
jgi:ATP-dependent Lon protease